MAFVLLQRKNNWITSYAHANVNGQGSPLNKLGACCQKLGSSCDLRGEARRSRVFFPWCCVALVEVGLSSTFHEMGNTAPAVVRAIREQTTSGAIASLSIRRLEEPLTLSV